MMCTVGGLLGGFPGSKSLNTLINIHETTFLLKTKTKRKTKQKFFKKISYLVNNSRLLYITVFIMFIYLMISLKRFFLNDIYLR